METNTNMEAYSEFATVYDEFMDNIPYDSWTKYLILLLKENNINDGIILDMGCGTGNITTRLSKKGFDMIGIDNSQEMLNIANEKKYEDNLDILYLNQDMRDFELYGTVKAIISICDSINYITEYDELVHVFKLVNNYLDPNGIFIFDLKTRKFFKSLGDSTIADNRDECSFIWENYFDDETGINEYELSIFLEAEDGRYDKFVESHFQKSYSIDEIINALKESGLEYIASYEAFSKNRANEDNDRIYFVAREKGKNGEMCGLYSKSDSSK